MTEGDQPTSPDTRRRAQSDSVFPSVTVIVVLVTVVAIALLFIGYRVFDLESQRRVVNNKLRLLEGRDEDVAEAEEKSFELSKLQNRYELLTRKHDKLSAEKNKLEKLIARQKTEIENGSERLRSIQGEANDQYNRRRRLREENRNLRLQVNTSKDEANRANNAAESADTKRDKLVSRVNELEKQERALETKVSKLQARYDQLVEGSKTLEKDQEQIKEIWGVLDALVNRMQQSSAIAKKSAESLENSKNSLETFVKKDLTPLTNKIAKTAGIFDREVKKVPELVKSLVKAEKGISDSNEQLKEISGTLGKSVVQIVEKIKKDQEYIKDISGKLELLVKNVQANSKDLDKTTKSILQTDKSLNTTVKKDLAETATQLQGSADQMLKQVKNIQDLPLFISKADRSVKETVERLEEASKNLGASYRKVSNILERLGNAEDKLGRSVEAIEKSAESLPTPDAGVADKFQDLTRQFLEHRKQSAQWSKDLNEIETRVPKAVKEYEEKLGEAEKRLSDAVDRLDKAVRLIGEVSKSARGSAKPPPQ